MNNNIEKFFKDLNYSDVEIKGLVSICPMLEELDEELMVANLSAVTSFGYPAEDISFLISTNPAFLCRNTEDLVHDLEKILNSTGDVEAALKDDPNLI